MTEDSLGTGVHHFKLETLHLDRLPGGRLTVVEKELRDIIGMFEKHSDVLELQHDVLLSVHLTDNMGECVDKVRNEYGIKAKAKYDPTRNAVVAQGIVLSNPKYPPLRTSIIFDQRYWIIDANDTMVIRTYLLSHEIEHVLQHAREADPIADIMDRPSKTIVEEMPRFAKIIMQEFDADKTAVSVCNGLLRNSEGGQVYPGETMGPWFLDGIQELIGKLKEFSRGELQYYRLTGIGLNGLHTKAGPLVGELLLVLVHAIPLYAQMDKMGFLENGLRDIPGFAECFREDYDALRDALVMEDKVAAEAEFIRIYTAILNRMGLRVEDTPQGLYVHVHEPLI